MRSLLLVFRLSLTASLFRVVVSFGLLPYYGATAWKTEQYATDGDETNKEEKPNLVSQELFVKAIDTLMEAAGQEAPSKQQTDETKKQGYAIGKLVVELPIIGDPGLDLAEADGLVLVTGVGQTASDAGIRTLDTITGVRLVIINSQKESTTLVDEACLEQPLSQVGPLIAKAAGLAVENELTTIELELNRLIRGYFG